MIDAGESEAVTPQAGLRGDALSGETRGARGKALKGERRRIKGAALEVRTCQTPSHTDPDLG